MKYTPVLLLLFVTACGSARPAPEPRPDPEPAASTEEVTPPALKTLQGEDAPWARVRGDKRTLLVFSTLW
jgi:hypothetical protein